MQKKSAAQKLKEMLEVIDFSEVPKYKDFNLSEFRKSVKEVRKTFKDENIRTCAC